MQHLTLYYILWMYIPNVFRRIRKEIIYLLLRHYIPNRITGTYPQLQGCIENLKIGNNVCFNPRVYIHLGDIPYQSIVDIGNNCVFSRDVRIISTTMMPSSFINRDFNHTQSSIIIGDNVWIGDSSLILQNVHISSNVVIAAGSIVTKDLLDEKCLYGGIPAKKIKELTI